MKKLMEYKIISGRTVEIKRSFLPVRSRGEQTQRRGNRRAGTSSEKKIKANEISCMRQLARTINVNFDAGDGFVTLKYDPKHLPADFTAAKKTAEKFMRKLRTAFKKLYGRNPKTILINANWSPRRKAPARLHHHLICEKDVIELARKLWEGGGFSLEILDSRGDHSKLAGYLIENLQGLPNEKHFHPSRNLDKPIYTEPVPVADVEGVQAVKGAVIEEHGKSEDEDGRVIGSYLRCSLPEKPRVRGGQIYLTRRPRRQTRPQSDYMPGILAADE